MDGDHEPRGEARPRPPSAVALHEQPGGHRRLERDVGRSQLAGEIVLGLGVGHAEAEALGERRGDAARTEQRGARLAVAARQRALLQRRLEKGRRRGVGRDEPLLLVAQRRLAAMAAKGSAVALVVGHAAPLGELRDRLLARQSLAFLHERPHVATRLTRVAVVDTLVVVDRHGRSSLRTIRVERASGHNLRAAHFHVHATFGHQL